jgi:hypothetical protein
LESIDQVPLCGREKRDCDNTGVCACKKGKQVVGVVVNGDSCALACGARRLKVRGNCTDPMSQIGEGKAPSFILEVAQFDQRQVIAANPGVMVNHIDIAEEL